MSDWVPPQGWELAPGGGVRQLPRLQAVPKQSLRDRSAWEPAVDVNERDTATARPEAFVIDGLQRPGDVLVIAGEEGDGKTTLAEQLCRQVLRRQAVLGGFPPGELAPERVLFVDTHQERPEQLRRAADMDRRGLEVPDGRMFWWHPVGANLASGPDRGALEDELARLGADYLWLDAASHLVPDPLDDQGVGALFDLISTLERDHHLRAVGMTLFTRKRAQGEHGRRFDDLFGSREWKGRASKVLYIEGTRVVAWKDRGGDLARAWPSRLGGRYPYATLERLGIRDEAAVPFAVTVDTPELVDLVALEAEVLRRVADEPGRYTKTSLADALGGKHDDARGVVVRLLDERRIGPNAPRARLRLAVAARDATLEGVEP